MGVQLAATKGYWFCAVAMTVLAVVATGCGQSNEDVQAPAPPTAHGCTADANCTGAGSFCDLGVCVQAQERWHYGWPCDPTLAERLKESDPLLYSKLQPCGAYICRGNGRCGSCMADSECDAPGTCNDSYPELPGKRCGLDAHVRVDPQR